MNDHKSPLDFEGAWQAKLAAGLERHLGPEDVKSTLAGGDELSMESSAREKAVWTCGTLERLDELLDQETRQEILAGCACQYPKEDLDDARAVYKETGDVDRVIEVLQAKFEHFLRGALELEQDLVEQITALGWGLAGRREGDRIIATKIPKSGYLVDYFNADDPLEKRKLYCHCPRVRDMVGEEPHLPRTYCYCGAGFYKGIWETILGQPVAVEVLKSVMVGDEVCQIAVLLPESVKEQLKI